eukprot:403342436
MEKLTFNSLLDRGYQIFVNEDLYVFQQPENSQEPRRTTFVKKNTQNNEQINNALCDSNQLIKSKTQEVSRDVQVFVQDVIEDWSRDIKDQQNFTEMDFEEEDRKQDEMFLASITQEQIQCEKKHSLAVLKIVFLHDNEQEQEQHIEKYAEDFFTAENFQNYSDANKLQASSKTDLKTLSKRKGFRKLFGKFIGGIIGGLATAKRKRKQKDINKLEKYSSSSHIDDMIQRRTQIGNINEFKNKKQ